MTLRATHRHTRATAYRRPGGPWDLPTLDGLLTAAPPNDVALVDGDVRLASADVERLTGRLAFGLRASGSAHGTAVAWQLPNSWEAVVLYRACWRLGCVAVPIHHRAGPAEVERVLATIEPAVVIGEAGSAAAAVAGAFVAGGSRLPARRGAASPTEAARDVATLFAQMDEIGPDAATARPSDIATVIFTAGSSGDPKAVVHTHRTLGYKARQMPEVHGLGPDDCVLMPAPLAHVSGLLNGLLVPTLAGMRSVLLARWNAGIALDLIEREHVTFMVGPPTFFVSLTSEPGFSSRRTRHLRLISSGGAGVTPAFVDDASRQLGATVKRTYGSTEAPTVATTSAGDDPVRARAHDGHAIGQAELKVVDPETGRESPTGVVGGFWVRGPELCAGYVDEADTREAFARGGWFRTGDLASVDDEGWLTILGRLKDVIIRAGENVSSAEVEAVLEQHPAVSQAAAVGYPDDLMGERVAAFIVTDDRFTLADCRRWFTEREVATFKTPERVLTVDDLPLLPTGKVDKAALRRQLLL